MIIKRTIFGIKTRYFNSAQFKGILQAVALAIILYYFQSKGNVGVAYFLSGATTMRILTLRRFF